jgi:PAS domain S-box-containing protein
VFENIQDVYYEMRPDGTILEMSPAGGDFFGAGRDAMIGRSLLPRYDSPEAHEAFVAALREKRRVTNYELRFRDASGRPRHALVSAERCSAKSSWRRSAWRRWAASRAGSPTTSTTSSP